MVAGRADVSKIQRRRLPYALLVSRFKDSVLDEVRPGGAAISRCDVTEGAPGCLSQSPDPGGCWNIELVDGVAVGWRVKERCFEESGSERAAHQAAAR